MHNGIPADIRIKSRAPHHVRGARGDVAPPSLGGLISRQAGTEDDRNYAAKTRTQIKASRCRLPAFPAFPALARGRSEKLRNWETEKPQRPRKIYTPCLFIHLSLGIGVLQLRSILQVAGQDARVDVIENKNYNYNYIWLAASPGRTDS